MKHHVAYIVHYKYTDILTHATYTQTHYNGLNSYIQGKNFITDMRRNLAYYSTQPTLSTIL